MIVFIMGLPRVGKTTFGKELSQKLSLSFTDLDVEIILKSMRETGSLLTIKELFLKEGEQAFRQREEEALSQLGLSSDSIMALGGGTLISKKNRELVERCGKSIYLKISEHILTERLRENPLAYVKEGSGEAVLKLSKERTPLFEEMADLTLDLKELSFEDALDDAVEWFHLVKNGSF